MRDLLLEYDQFADPDEEALYRLVDGYDRIPEYLLGVLSPEEPNSISFGGVSIQRATPFSQVIPFLNQSLDLVNACLPPEYDRLKMSFFTKPTICISNGKVIDISDQWRGSSFFAIKDDTILGLCIARQERVYTQGSWESTDRGYVPIVVANPVIRGTFIPVLLGLLSAKSLLNRGVQELNGSCEVGNRLVDRVYTRFSRQRWQEGNWVRYIYDNEKIEILYQEIVPKMGLDIAQVNLLLS